jgi:hypothetical protein
MGHRSKHQPIFVLGICRISSFTLKVDGPVTKGALDLENSSGSSSYLRHGRGCYLSHQDPDGIITLNTTDVTSYHIGPSVSDKNMKACCQGPEPLLETFETGTLSLPSQQQHL